MSYRYDYFDYYKPQKPKEAKGGIKAQSGRGSFGKSWWAKRWISVLESFNIGARLGRGRSYARQGQVVAIEISKGFVQAKVQGTRPTPYKITIEIKPLDPAQWQQVAEILSQKAVFSAKLLVGEMPENIEEAFKAAKLSLFPERLNDLKTDCSCPDWSNPCKHIAAVYYLLGEEFDRDPFLIFKLRGIEREELINLLGAKSSGLDTHEKSERLADLNEKIVTDKKSPLPPDAGVFWEGPERKDREYNDVEVPRTSAALPKRLGSFPFWRGGEVFLPTLEDIYQRASLVGMDVFLGQ